MQPWKAWGRAGAEICLNSAGDVSCGWGEVFFPLSAFFSLVFCPQSRHWVVLASSPFCGISMGLWCRTLLNARRCQWEDGAAAGSGAEARWVFPEELSTVLFDCIAVITHKDLILTRTRTFQHTPWNSLDLHHVCVGSLTTKDYSCPQKTYYSQYFSLKLIYVLQENILII